MSEVALKNLQKRNNYLKSKLLHEQLKHGNYPFKNFKRESLHILSEYRIHKSIFKATLNVGISYNVAIKWFIQGQMGNPHFRDFYSGISRINNNKSLPVEDETSKITDFEDDFKISKYGDGWSYTTYVDGKKVFLISNELDSLKKKIADRKLPFN